MCIRDRYVYSLGFNSLDDVALALDGEGCERIEPQDKTGGDVLVETLQKKNVSNKIDVKDERDIHAWIDSIGRKQ